MVPAHATLGQGVSEIGVHRRHGQLLHHCQGIVGDVAIAVGEGHGADGVGDGAVLLLYAACDDQEAEEADEVAPLLVDDEVDEAGLGHASDAARTTGLAGACPARRAG